MAQKVQVILVDDMDGGAAEETVSFSLDGVSYELDLSKKNAAKLRDTFAHAQMILSGPMLVLYILSIGVAWVFQRKRRTDDDDKD